LGSTTSVWTRDKLVRHTCVRTHRATRAADCFNEVIAPKLTTPMSVAR
jgi:hypothetical protein